MRILSFLYIALILLIIEFAPAQAKQVSYIRVAVDKVWTGTAVGYAALEHDGGFYVAYFNDARQMMVASYDKVTGRLSYKTLPNFFDGWDSHNSLALALDAKGRLHVAGNMHASSLVYGRMKKPHDLESLYLVNRMVGEEEDHVTYPQFITMADGRLLFFYRAGKSGQGRHFINIWNNNRWDRWLSRPLFSYEPATPESAYPTTPRQDPQGIWHMAWVWRTTPDAATNCCVSYARSDNLREWKTHRGENITLPITRGEGSMVDSVPARSGLLNNLKLSFLPNGAPAISYQKQDANGDVQIYNSFLNGEEFLSVPATRWKERWTPSGGGSLNAPIGFSEILSAGQDLVWQKVRNSQGGQTIFLNPVTLTPLTVTPKASHRFPSVAPMPPGDALPEGMRWRIMAIAAPRNLASGAFLRWQSYPSARDKAKSCSPEMPEACRPPASRLELIIPNN
jgi:hypothetical protein